MAQVGIDRVRLTDGPAIGALGEVVWPDVQITIRNLAYKITWAAAGPTATYDELATFWRFVEAQPHLPPAGHLIAERTATGSGWPNSGTITQLLNATGVKGKPAAGWVAELKPAFDASVAR